MTKTPPLLAAVLFGLYASSLYSYLLFHSLVELFSVLTAFAVFVLAWNTRRIQDNHYVLFIGIASLFSGTLDLVHTLAYKGMGVFPVHDANLPTQLWIAFRYLFSLSLLLAPRYLSRTLKPERAFVVYAAVTAALLGSIFLGWFPACFVEGAGLTRFKIVSEYAIAGFFLAALWLLRRKAEFFEPRILRLLTWSIVASTVSELSFTQYVSVYGPANMIGHFALFASVVFLYRAIVVTGIAEPSRLLFRSLKLSEEKISKLNEELQHTVTRLEEANRELESFSFSVSHDLRAPLRSIDGFSKALLDDCADKLDAQGRQYLDNVLAASGRMAGLIDALLHLSRMSRSEVRRSAVDLSAMAQATAEDLKKSQPGRCAEFSIAEGLNAEGDPAMLRSVVENLLGNAWKFTAKKETAHIEFGTERKEGKNVYFVRDNGDGFAMAYANKLFAVFQRLHSADDFPGLGIGLATVRRIIIRHGGSVWAEGEAGKGATFYFTLH